MTLKVLPLAPEHVEDYRRLMLHGFQHAGDAFTSTFEERQALPLEWWKRRLCGVTGECCAFGAFRGKELVGAVALEFSTRPKTSHKAFLIGLYVLDSARGLGAGRSLVEAVLGLARRRGIRAVVLTVTDGNGPALKLYEAAGFQTFGVEPFALRSGGELKAKRHMWREIPEATADPVEGSA